MEFIRGLHNIKLYHKNCVLAIGNFDGFHCGHQALISRLKIQGDNRKLPVMVMIFEPQPKEYLFNSMSTRLMTLRDKVNYLSSAGVDLVLCVAFNKKFASLKAYTFIKNILISKLRVRFVYVGSDFRFGALRTGDFVFLKQVGLKFGFEVMCFSTRFDKSGNKISSSAIRTALLNDRILDAELLLGHTYSISGRVVHGNKLGGMLGFPTANLSLQGKRLPICGVYAVEVYGIISNFPILGIANIGMRPTVSKNVIKQGLEVHLLDVSINLYTHHIKVVFLAKIRNEQFFDSMEMLQLQIKNDVSKVRAYFNKKKYINNFYSRNNL